MKILHIIDSGGLYGAEIMLLNLISEQIKLGLEPVIASIGTKHISEKIFETEAINRGVNVQKFRMQPGPNFIGAVKILKFAKRQGFDLLHSHGYKGNILFGFIPKTLRQIPLISTLHGWTSTTGISKMKFYEWLDSLSLNFIDAIILVNKSMKNNNKLLGRKKLPVHIIDNGIDNSTPFNCNSSELDQSLINFCNSGFSVGAIGRLAQEKGYDNLIEAIKIVSQRRKDIRLLIIGDGPERIKLEQDIERMGLKKNVMISGYRKNAKNYAAYFNIFVLSSLTEGLPITILEMMSAGVPIIATRVGGVPEVLDYGKAGILSKTPDCRDLALEIIKLIQNPALMEKLSKAARERVLESYDSKKMAMQYLKVYQLLDIHRPQ